MKPAFDVKSVRLDVLTVQLHIADLAELEEFLRQHTGQYRELDAVPFTLDVRDFDHPEFLNTGAVVSLFARYGMQILDLRHTSEAWAPYVTKLHLVFTLGDSAPIEPQSKAATPVLVRTPAVGNPTISASTPVRTGQQVYTENADLIITGAVNQGIELIADGSIHAYTPMCGCALADASGNRNAKIFVHPMQAELVSVAGVYRNFEQDLPDHLHREPVQILLQNDRSVISAIDTE